jgi:hypothetical protein
MHSSSESHREKGALSESLDPFVTPLTYVSFCIPIFRVTPQIRRGSLVSNKSSSVLDTRSLDFFSGLCISLNLRLLLEYHHQLSFNLLFPSDSERDTIHCT